MERERADHLHQCCLLVLETRWPTFSTDESKLLCLPMYCVTDQPWDWKSRLTDWLQRMEPHHFNDRLGQLRVTLTLHHFLSRGGSEMDFPMGSVMCRSTSRAQHQRFALGVPTPTMYALALLRWFAKKGPSNSRSLSWECVSVMLPEHQHSQWKDYFYSYVFTGALTY